jgi:undecaprenyl-diphosphatase
MASLLNIDTILFQYINNLAGRNLMVDAAGIFFAKYAEYPLLGALSIFLFIASKKYWPMVWQSFVAAIFSRFIVTELIRFLWARQRPFVGNDVHLLIGEVNQFSFPSGHAAFYFALSAVVYSYNKKAGILFFATSFLIAVARIFVGVHWPSDIIVGALIGVLSGVLVVHFFRKQKRY